MDLKPSEFGKASVRKSSRLSMKPRRNVRMYDRSLLEAVKYQREGKLCTWNRSTPPTIPFKPALKLGSSGVNDGNSRPASHHPSETELDSSKADGVSQIEIFECRVCRRVFLDEETLTTHEKTKHPLKRRCHVCGIYLQNQTELAKHTRGIHQQSAMAVKCDFCDHIARNRKALIEHCNQVHTKTLPKNERCREMVDGVQCEARFVRISQLREHLTEVHGLVAAGDTIREEFSTMEDFLRWKVQYERENEVVYNIGYGRRNGVHRYMCSRSGVYKPVPFDTRQRRLKTHGTIKLGFNCTSTMVCRFPEQGGVLMTLHPFHYGHTPGDLPVPGIVPDDMPADWVPKDVTRKRHKHQKSLGNLKFSVLTVPAGYPGPGGATAAPEPAETAAERAPSASSAETALTGAGDTAGLEPAWMGGGGGGQSEPPQSEDGRPGPAPGQKQEQEQEEEPGPAGPGSPPSEETGAAPPPRSRQPTRLSARLARAPSARPSPSPPPQAEKKKRLASTASIGGPGGSYKKLLKSMASVRRLQGRLSAQMEQLAAARQEQARAATGAATPDGFRPVRASPEEDEAGVPGGGRPLTVLRSEPADLDEVPDGLFPALDVLSAPIDLEQASRTILDLKLEVMALRARLVRRVVAETELRTEAVEAGTRHLRAEGAARTEAATLRAEAAGGPPSLRSLIGRVFSPAQVATFENPEHPVVWGQEDYMRALRLRALCSEKAFAHVRTELAPLPSMAAVRRAVALGAFPEVSARYLELMEENLVGRLPDVGDSEVDEADEEAAPLGFDGGPPRSSELFSCRPRRAPAARRPSSVGEPELRAAGERDGPPAVVVTRSPEKRKLSETRLDEFGRGDQRSIAFPASPEKEGFELVSGMKTKKTPPKYKTLRREV